MIKSGLNKLITRNYEWPPSAPEFANLCRPSIEDFDVPTFDEAIRLIGVFCRRKDTRLDPFTFSMYLRIGGRMYDLNRMPERDYRAEMKRYYDATAKALVAGAEMSVQPEMIESQAAEPKPIQDSEQKFDELRKVLD